MSKIVDWTTCTVKDVVERHFCGPSPDCEERQIFAPEEWGVLKTTAITWAGWDEKAHKVLPKVLWGQSKVEVQAGDVLVTKAGPRNRVGVVCHIPSTRSQLIVSGKMIGLRPIPEAVNASFLAGFLATQEPQKYIHDRTTGMAESQVNFANEVLLDTPLRVPPIQEQNLIGKVLDTFDTAIRETESIIDKLKVVKQGLLHDLLTRGVDANGILRPNPSETPQLYKESPLGWIPKEWNVNALGSCADISSGVTLGRSLSGFGAIELPYLRVANVQDGYLDLRDIKTVSILPAELSRFSLDVGDVLMNEGGDFDKLGRGAVWEGQIEPCLHQNHVFRVRCNRAKLLPDFLAAYSGSARGKAYFVQASKQTTNLASINSTQLKAFEITCPTIAEQEMIIRIVKGLDDKAKIEKRRLDKLHSQKSGLMDDLLTGRVRVTPLLEGAITS